MQRNVPVDARAVSNCTSLIAPVDTLKELHIHPFALRQHHRAPATSPADPPTALEDWRKLCRLLRSLAEQERIELGDCGGRVVREGTCAIAFSPDVQLLQLQFADTEHPHHSEATWWPSQQAARWISFPDYFSPSTM